MADRIKGITVVIGGDTTGLSKALSGVNKEISSTQKQLKDVERLLKLDPGNTELLAQKQRLLNDAVDQTKTKLNALQDAEKQVQQQFERGEVSQEQYDSLKREIVSTEVELRNAERAAFDLQEQLIQSASDEALKEMESAAKDLEKQINSIDEAPLDEVAGSAEKAKEELAGAEKKAKDVSSSLSDMSDKAKKLSSATAPATAAIGGLAAATVATVPGTEELRSNLSKLDENARENAVSADIARAAWREFALQSGETDSAVEATSNLLQAGFTESNLQKAVEGLAGAAQRFPDTLKIESLADSLQETLATGTATGQFGELLDRVGIGAENFSKKLETCTSEAKKQDLVLQALAEAGLNDSYNAWKKNNEEMLANQEANLKTQEAMANLAESILPIVTDVTNKVADLINWFNGLSPATQSFIATLLAFVAAISPVASAVSNVSEVLSKLSNSSLPSVTKAVTKISTYITATAVPGITASLKGLFAFLSANPVVLVIAAITAAVIALVALIATKGDEIKKILQKFDDWLQKVFAKDWSKVFGPVLGEYLNAFLANVKNIWDSVKKIFDGVIDFIRGVFTGDWERAWKGVQEIFSGIFEGLAAIAKSPINGIIGLLNGLINAINSVINKINKLKISMPKWLGGGSIGFNIPNISSIPYLAKGGKVLSGSAIVGEAGPELLTVGPSGTIVQPLTSSERLASATQKSVTFGDINIDIHPSAGMNVEQLADYVGLRIQQLAVQKEEAF